MQRVRGSKTTSVLANLFSERFIGFAFLALGYSVPNTQLTYEQLNAMVSLKGRFRCLRAHNDRIRSFKLSGLRLSATGKESQVFQSFENDDLTQS